MKNIFSKLMQLQTILLVTIFLLCTSYKPVPTCAETLIGPKLGFPFGAGVEIQTMFEKTSIRFGAGYLPFFKKGSY